MSGWLHPEGPETAATYWSRRLVVIAAAVVVMVLCGVLINRAAQGTEPVRTAAPAPATEPIGPYSTVASPTPSGTSPSASSASPSPTDEPSSTARSSSTSPSSSPSTAPSSAPSGSASASDSDSSAEPSGAPTPSRVELCDPADLRATLQGDPSPAAGKPVVFSLSLINGSATTCAVSGTAETMELKVTSGSDRIWTTADCAEKVPSIVADLKPEQAKAWKVTWNGARSAADCGKRSEQPQPGTYVASFSYEGTKAVRQRMVLSAR